PQASRPASNGDDRAAMILVTHEASVVELFAVDLDRLAGVVVEHGGPQSHASILARSLGIPMVGQVSNFGALLHPGRLLHLDGGTGVVTLDPRDESASADAEPGAPSSARPMRATLAEGLPRLEVN